MISCSNTNWNARSNRAEMKQNKVLHPSSMHLGGELLHVKHTVSPKFHVDKKLTIDVPLSIHLCDNVLVHIPPRYAPIKVIGRGTYGAVISALDKQTGRTVAIKKCRAFGEDEDFIETGDVELDSLRKILTPRRILREMLLLCHLQHPNLINLHQFIPPQSYKQFKDVYMVTDLMQSDLGDVLQHSAHHLSERHTKYLMYQMLSAVAYLHSQDIVHRDLKPGNVLIDDECNIRICDFGMARHNSELNATMSTNYVQTREYRAPELLLNCPVVTKGIDIWSIGCIMAEIMRNGQALFAGASPVQQIDEIIKVLGTPKAKDIRASESGFTYLVGLAYCTSTPLTKHINTNYSPLAMDLLAKLLVFCPEKRLTAVEALKHPWLQEFHDDSSMDFLENAQPFDFSYEENIHSTEDVKTLAFHLILEYEGITKTEKSPLPNTPMMSPIERDAARMNIKLMSPVAKATQQDLKMRITSSQKPLVHPKKRHTMLHKVKQFFRKHICVRPP